MFHIITAFIRQGERLWFVGSFQDEMTARIQADGLADELEKSLKGDFFVSLVQSDLNRPSGDEVVWEQIK